MGVALSLLLAGCGSGEPEPSRGSTTTEPPPYNGDGRDWADETFGSFEKVSVSGSGDDTVEIPPEVGEAEMGIIELDYTGDGMKENGIGFLAALVDAEGELLLAGPDSMWLATDGDAEVQGQVLWAPHQNGFTEAQVQARGDWTMTFTPISTAAELPAEGVGSWIYLYDGSGGDTTMRHDERYPTDLAEYTEPGSARRVIELRGPETDGSLSEGPSVVVVSSRGSWSLDLP